MQSSKNLRQWGEVLYRYADQLLAEAEPVERQQLNELLLELAEHYASVHDEALALEVIISWLEGMVSERKSSTGFLRGQLTFCSMLPMRSIPFKVIVLLGMNDGEFPKIDRHPTFDLLGQNFRPGDRSRRADDRYQFLEILLSARQQLMISYIGQSMQHNKEIPPSVIVSELLDVLAEHYQLSDLTVRHPLQSFSMGYFDGRSEQLFSYVHSDCETARRLHDEKAPEQPWWQDSIEAENDEMVEIADLFAFYRHPQRYFMQRQLGLRYYGLSVEAEEREAFALDALESYAVQQDWIHAALHDDTLSLPKLQAEGRWLLGAPGELAFAQQQPAIEQFVERIKSKGLGEERPELAIDIAFERYRLVGKLANLYQKGSLLYRFSSLKGKDFIQAWLHHLLINRLESQDTVLLSKDKDLLFPAALARSEDLQVLIDIFQQGQRRPDVFFTEAVFDYLQQGQKVKASTRPITEPLAHTIAKMQERIARPYEPELRQLFSHDGALTQAFGEDFAAQCEALLQPIWEAVYER
nr:exodeoxyribonuclease V subunit gamma [Methylomarinum sp. Ch1-1]MDP4522498.1 exodeoxyribonuclease V subunit gamma [Methylomarinum sp. Ch1-1]